MTLNLNNYVYLILINFAICIGAYLIYFSLNYLFDIKLIKRYAEKIFRNYKIIFNILSGTIMGIINFFGIYISYNWYPEINIILILYLPLLIVVGVSYKPSLFISYLMTILFSLLIFSFIKNVGFINFTFHLILVIIGCCFVVTIKLLKLTNNKVINFSFIIVYTGIIILIFWILIKTQPIIYIIIQSMFIFILYLFTYFLNSYIENFINKINELNKASMYEINNFYKENIAFTKINESKKIAKNGLMCIINFTNIFNLPIKLGNHMSNYMQQKLLTCFFESLRKFKPIFFITSKNEYAFYIPIKKLNLQLLNEMYNGNKLKVRNLNDPLYKLENSVNYIPKELIFENEKINVNFNINCSIYGLHSCDNIKLLKMSRLASRNYNETNKNIVKLYNPLIDINYKVNYKEINELQKHFGPDCLEIKFKKDDNWIYPHVSIVNHLLFDITDIKKYAKENNIYSITLRWIAMQCIKQYSKQFNNNILIEYPIEHVLNSQFNIINFKRKLNLLNIDLNKLIFKFNLNDINLTNSNNIIYKNIWLISKLGINIYFTNFDEKYVELIKLVKPNWISINQNYKKYNEYYEKLITLVLKFGINLI